MYFNDKVVLVTGSSRGIGKAIATRFAMLGATVILNGSKDKESLTNTYSTLKSKGYNVFMYMADVSSYKDTKMLFDSIFNDTGKGVDILINNAGISSIELFTSITPDMWSTMINTNLTSVFNTCSLAVPHMIREKAGNIINISSIWGNTGASCEVAYSATKGGINSFSKSLGKELGPCNIRVNAIACGFIDTTMNSSLSKEEQDAFIQDIPLCRAGKPEEVADLCVYLATSGSSYITGQVINLDGGLI